MSARDKILGRIRKAQGRSGRPSQAELEAVETYLRAHPRGPQPRVEGDLVACFLAKAQSLASTTDTVAREADVPAAVARYVKVNNLPASGCVWPALAHLDWQAAGLRLEARGAHGEDALGVTGVFAAIAETGTLMTVSGPETPAATSLVPETHIAVVPARRMLARMEDAWELARAELGRLPRAVNFISGPSRTGDIEQTIVLGAHGPYRVHIIVVMDGAPDRGQAE